MLSNPTFATDPELRSADLGTLIFPRSVALVGVSDRTDPEIVANVARAGTRVAGVHPRHSAVHGLRCVPRIADLPTPVELGFLLVGHRHIEAAFAEAVAAGIRAFVVPGLGNESGAAGPAVAERLRELALEAQVALVGFNCMGVAVPDRASCWIGTVPRTFRPGHVAIVVHSGSIGEALLALGPRIGFRCVVSSGSEAVRDLADLCAFFAADEGTRVVGLFVETIRRPAAFTRALELLARANKPVVCLKVGRSSAAAGVVLAHSGALVSSDRALSAVLRAYGVIEVDDYPEFVEVLDVLGLERLPRGRRIGGVSNSGGEGALLADHGEAAGMPFQPLRSEVAQRLRTAFPNYVSPQNPVDAWAIDDVDRVFKGTLDILARSGDYDILLAQVDQSQYLGEPEAANALVISRALADAVKATEIFPAVTSVQTNDPTPAVQAFAKEHQIALLRGSRNGMRALSAVAGWVPRRPPERAGRVAIAFDRGSVAGPLAEFESARLLERYGIPVTAARRARTAQEAREAAIALGFPVVVKLDGPSHKSRAGGVILNLHDADAVYGAARRLAGPTLVARQVPAGFEVYCGFSRDRDFGPILAIGPGGQAVEDLALAAFSLCPIDLDQARRLLAAAPIVWRAATGRAVESLAEVLVALGWLAVDHPEVAAVDVNPLILHDGDAIAVDALVVIEGGIG
jgi:acetate---CoA ligase (ADP-forming)